MSRRVRVGRQVLDVPEPWIDRLISYVAPDLGARRFQARLRTAMVDRWSGASASRRSLASWRTSGGDADEDTLPELDRLRVRSRDLIRNQPLAAGAINTKITSIIGTGLILNPRIDAEELGLNDEQAQAIEGELWREWELWAGTAECDLERTSTFVELQELAFRSALENGDVLVLMPFVEREGSPYALKLQLVEADRCSNPGWAADSARLAGGVERDENGAPAAYHISRTHPGARRGLPLQWDRIPAFGERTGRRNVLHIYRKLRVGQTRGVPDLAPVIEPLKMIGRYTESELMASVVASFLTVFVKTESGEGLGPMQPLAETGASATDDEVRLGNGAIIDLAPGEDVTTVDPSRPNTAFDPFVLAILRQVGVALELPYEVLIKHYTASYSAARAAMLEAWKFYRARRQWLARSFCQPVYEAFVTEAVLRGRLSLPGFASGDPRLRQAYLGCAWVGPAKGQIDEQKEVDAAIKRMDANLTTLEYETAEMTGADWETNLWQRRRERRALAEADLLPAPAEPNRPGGEPVEEGSDRDDELPDDRQARR